MIYLLASFMLISVSSDSTGKAFADERGGAFITAEEMRESGLTRLHDLLRLADSWDAYSKDGFTWHAGAGGFLPPGGSEWQLHVGGHRVNLWTPAGVTLNRLPVSPAMIRAVDVRTRPGYTRGQVADGALLRVELERPAPGFQGTARGLLGNEAGDPGPFFYTDRAVQNVDKTGPDASLGLAYGGDRVFVSGMAYVQRDFPTDGALITRYLEDYDRYPTLLLVSSAIQAGLDLPSGTHALLSGVSYFDQYYTREATMELLPARSLLAFNGISGNWRAGSATWNYVLQHTFNQLEPRGGVVASEFYFSYNELLSSVEWTRAGESLETAIGAQVSRASVSADAGDAATATLGTVSGRVGRSLRERDVLSVSASASTDGSASALKAGIAYEAALSGRHTARLDVFGGGRLIQEDISHWYLAESRRPGDGSSAPPDEGIGRKAATGYGALGWTWQAAERLRLVADAAARYVRRPVLDPYFPGMPAGANAPEWLDGATAIYALEIEHQPHDRILHRVLLRYRHSLARRSAWNDVTDILPAEKARYTVVYRPLPGLSLSGRMEYDGARTWRNIPGRPNDPTTLETYRIRPSLTFDVSLQKYFLDEQLRASVQLRNLHDGYRRFHPHGKHFNMILFLQMEVGFPRIR